MRKLNKSLVVDGTFQHNISCGTFCLLLFSKQGVHLDEPSPSLAEHRWSSHVSGAVKPKWTDEDLDAFVRQLSNPQHHVTKLGPIKAAAGGSGRHSAHVQSRHHLPGSGGLDSPRKDSFELCHELQEVDRVRAPLARSETDTSVALTCERHNQHQKDITPNLSRSGEDMSRSLGEGGPTSSSNTGSGGGGLISGLSGLRLIKNKKLARSSHANAKRSAAAAAMQKSKDDVSGTPSPAAASEASPAVTFSCNGSSPESSDVEASTSITAPIAPDQTFGSGKEGAVTSKKRRFRKILSRPLNRSQSAGCAKDVPAHALFLEKQQKKSKDDDLVSTTRSVLVRCE